MSSAVKLGASNAIEVLSSVPMFSWDLAADLVCTRFDLKSTSARREVSAILPALLRTGGVEKIGDLYRVTEGLRSTAIPGPNSSWLKSAARIFAEHCASSLRDPMRAVLGKSVFDLYSSTFAAISDLGGKDNTSEFVHKIYAAGEYGRRDDVYTARRLVRRYLGENHRLSLFAGSIEMWHSDATVAEKMRALQVEGIGSESDTAHAVSLHLYGVLCMKQAKYAEGKDYLRNSIRMFSALNDNRGATKATTSLARLIRNEGENTGDFDAINESINLFDYSDRLARTLHDQRRFERDLALGRAEIGRSRSYLALKLAEPALKHAQFAVAQLRESPDSQLWARTNLSEIQLTLGLVNESIATWGDYIEQAFDSGADEKALVASIISLVRARAGAGDFRSSIGLIERGIELANRGGFDKYLGTLYLLRSEANLAGWYKTRMANESAIKRSMADARRSVNLYALTNSFMEVKEASRQVARIERIFAESNLSADLRLEKSDLANDLPGFAIHTKGDSDGPQARS